ncbi:GNAT family N-acetyltransferase [Bacillus sp. N9]
MNREKRGIRWEIELLESEEFIGTIGFNAWSPKHKRAEIGYELHPHYWKKGTQPKRFQKMQFDCPYR